MTCHWPINVHCFDWRWWPGMSSRRWRHKSSSLSTLVQVRNLTPPAHPLLCSHKKQEPRRHWQCGKQQRPNHDTCQWWTTDNIKVSNLPPSPYLFSHKKQEPTLHHSQLRHQRHSMPTTNHNPPHNWQCWGEQYNTLPLPSFHTRTKPLTWHLSMPRRHNFPADTPLMDDDAHTPAPTPIYTTIPAPMNNKQHSPQMMTERNAMRNEHPPRRWCPTHGQRCPHQTTMTNNKGQCRQRWPPVDERWMRPPPMSGNECLPLCMSPLPVCPPSLSVPPPCLPS